MACAVWKLENVNSRPPSSAAPITRLEVAQQPERSDARRHERHDHDRVHGRGEPEAGTLERDAGEPVQRIHRLRHERDAGRPVQEVCEVRAGVQVDDAVANPPHVPDVLVAVVRVEQEVTRETAPRVRVHHRVQRQVEERRDREARCRVMTTAMAWRAGDHIDRAARRVASAAHSSCSDVWVTRSRDPALGAGAPTAPARRCGRGAALERVDRGPGDADRDDSDRNLERDREQQRLPEVAAVRGAHVHHCVGDEQRGGGDRRQHDAGVAAVRAEMAVAPSVITISTSSATHATFQRWATRSAGNE